MKTSAALLALAALVLAPAPAVGREAMLGGDDEASAGGGRRLGFFKKNPEYYQSIYYRCCNTADGEEGDDNAEGAQSQGNPAWRREDAPSNISGNCNCPKRGSNDKSWFGYGPTYFAKWQKSCAPGGTIPRKAGIKPGNSGNAGD